MNKFKKWTKDFISFMRRPTTYPMIMLGVIGLFLNSDQNLIAPNLTQVAQSFNFTDDQRDTLIGGQLSIGFFVVGGISAILVGYLADKVNRKNLFTLVVLMGESACFCTLFVVTYAGLFATRAVTGISVGGANPLIYSMIGDMFDDKHRGKAISFITIMLSLGVAVGQSVAGLVGPADAFGWRAPFAVIAVPTFILAPIYCMTNKDPPRGSKEEAVITLSEQTQVTQVYSEKMDVSKLKLLMKNKTAILCFIQGIPGSLPWGVMLTFFQDFLVQDIGPNVPGGISVQQSTLVVLTFGAGSAVGLVSGGFIADRLWKTNPRKVAIVMSITTAIGALPIYGLVNGPPQTLAIYAFITLPCGFLASITGTAVKAVLMNVTLPETRGTAFAFSTLFDDIGRGLGPLWVSLMIQGLGGRIPAFNYALGGWFVCAFILFLIFFTVDHDLKKLQMATEAAMERRRSPAPNEDRVNIVVEGKILGGIGLEKSSDSNHRSSRGLSDSKILPLESNDSIIIQPDALEANSSRPSIIDPAIFEEISLNSALV